jgi:hypothetical protein
MEDRFLVLAAELARLEQRKREILNEIRKAGGFDDKQRELLLGILGESPQAQFDFDGPGPLFRHSVSRRNILDEIRNILASDPAREFSATEIKTRLRIDPLNEKSFYSALAKLHKLGQIRRVGRALYKTASRTTKKRPNSKTGVS